MWLLALPKMPCGLTIRTMIRTANPTAIFQRKSMKSVDHSITSPRITPPASAPKASPMPPRITAAKHRQQEFEAKRRLDIGDGPREHSRQARHPARQDPRVQNDPRGVDAGSLGQVEVVG